MANGQTQTSGPGVITSKNADTRTLNHRGTEVGSANVTRSQNTTGRYDEILRWTVPKKFVEMVVAGGKHYTKAILRTTESITGTTGDDTTISLSTNIVPIAGEPTVADQPFPVAVVYNVTTSTQYTVTDADYEANTITVGTDAASGDTVKVWPVMSEGVLQYRGENAFNHQVGPLDEWGTPAHVFADFNQEKNTTQIHLPGAARFEDDEHLVLLYDAPRQVTWTDADFPNGQYVSKVEQRVDVVV